MPNLTVTIQEATANENMLEFMLDFRINMYSASGIAIDSISIHKEAYNPFKGGRSFVRSGTSRYVIRY
jgi:hypothetical protein